MLRIVRVPRRGSVTGLLRAWPRLHSRAAGSAECGAMSPADASPAAREVGPPLRVRTRKDYSVPFLVDAGQRNAVFVRRKWTPLRRVLPWADASATLPEPDFDIAHAVNAVPILPRRPYVLTFEDYLPRTPEDRYVGWLERALQRTLLSDR